MRVAIVADDLTGATDSGAQLSHAGYRTAVAFHGSSLPPDRNLDAIVVDTDSRSLPPELACQRVRDATRHMGDARILYKKLDSTLRGQVVAEAEAALRESGRPRAILAPAFPDNGRTTERGVQVVHGEPVHKTRFAEDPATPVREGHIPSLLVAGGLDEVGTLDLGDLKYRDRVRSVIANHRWTVADATEKAHLKTLVEAVPDPSEVLWVGSAGLAQALAIVYPGPRAKGPSPGSTCAARRILVVVGSLNSVAREQLHRLEQEAAVELISLEAGVPGAGESMVRNVVKAIRERLDDKGSAALYSTDEEVSPEAAGRVVESLAEVVAALSEKKMFDALVLTGGDTAVHVARGLEARGILLEDEIEPGVPMGALIGPRPYRVITKAGGFGTPDTLVHALHTLAGKE